MPDDDAAEGSTSHVNNPRPTANDETNDGTSGGRAKKKWSKEEKKNKRGANKGRRFQKVRDDVELCWRIASGRICEFGDQYGYAPSLPYLPAKLSHRCRNTHDVTAYLAAKPKDIIIPPVTAFSDAAPFVSLAEDTDMSEGDGPPFDPRTHCPVFDATGECRYGLKCRFLGGHARLDESGQTILVVDEEKKAVAATTQTELNTIDGDILKRIRTKKV